MPMGNRALMRIWILIVVAIVAITGGVLYASEAQQSTWKTNLREAQTADSMGAEFLDQERGLGTFLAAHDAALLRPYYESGRVLASELREAREVSADDQLELKTIAAQTAAWHAWRAVANTARRGARRGVRPTPSETRRRNALINRFGAANEAYEVRLAS